MHAALVTAHRTVELTEFDEPDPSPDQVVVDIAYCGVCGTDVHAFEGPGGGSPSIFGHEWSGTVSKIGGSVTNVAEGDRVVVGVPPACGQCDACRANHPESCTTVMMATIALGPFATPHGGFAPKLAVHAGRAIPTNPALTETQAAQIEPATICFHAVRATAPHLGDVAVIQGAGPIGVSTLQWARAAGAGQIVVIEPQKARRVAATNLGAHHAVAPGAEATNLVMELSKGLGADVVYECAGIPATVQSAVDLTRKGGRMCIIGLAVEDAPISPVSWLMKEIHVSASLGYTNEEFEMAMGYVADGRVDLDATHSGTIGLSDLAKTLDELATGSSDHTKVLVDPNV